MCVITQARHEKDEPVDELLALVKQIVPYHMTHNAGGAVVAAVVDVFVLGRGVEEGGGSLTLCG